MGIVKETIQKQIESKNLQYMRSSTTATILRYDKIFNKADIVYPNPVGDGTIYRGGIPVSNSLGGLTNGGVKSGQKCTITFVNGNINAPLITGINDSTYQYKSCEDQGAYIIDESIREQTDNDIGIIAPMYSDWLDEDNTWQEKYRNTEIDYCNIDTSKAARTISSDTIRFSDNEVGLTHLNTKATLKMKDNGDIDIFVSDNVGIRISKKMRKIYLYGFDININGKIDLLSILKKCHDCEFEGYRNENNKENIKDEINEYIRYIEDDIEELKKCIEYTKEITGDVQHFSYLDNAIDKFEKIKKKYNEGKYNDSIEDLQDAYEQIMTYYKYFEEELTAARERWGLT